MNLDIAIPKMFIMYWKYSIYISTFNNRPFHTYSDLLGKYGQKFGFDSFVTKNMYIVPVYNVPIFCSSKTEKSAGSLKRIMPTIVKLLNYFCWVLVNQGRVLL